MEPITLEAKILNEYRTIAVVGASPNPMRAASLGAQLRGV